MDKNIKLDRGVPNGIEPEDERALPSSLARTILDSSLISTTKISPLYNIKVINCREYVQLYSVQNAKLKPKGSGDKNSFDELSLINKVPLNDVEYKKNDADNLKEGKIEFKTKTIELKNIMRSKLACQRLAKCNSNYWKTFITLTIKENVTDINKSNKLFNNFITQVRRVFKELKYIAIPEFQKRGAVHYHLLSNIDVENDLIYHQVDKQKFLHIKYWNYGFTKVDRVKGDIKKIIGYISKYMTKNIDDRLFSKHRYLYSQNLEKPSIIYINTNNEKELSFLNNLLNNKSLIYENTYINSYDNEKIKFTEYLKNS